MPYELRVARHAAPHVEGIGSKRARECGVPPAGKDAFAEQRESNIVARCQSPQNGARVPSDAARILRDDACVDGQTQRRHRACFERPPGVSSIAAHLILGARDEPFLEAMLDSIAGVVSLLIVNDNAPDPSPHAQTLARSAFGTGGRIVVDRTPFSGFAAARNICLALHAKHGAVPWVAFIDADEVHGPRIQTIAQRLDRVPDEYDFVDGYTWHFFGSFDYYTSIERRMMFFRYARKAHWEGAVHEQLLGLSGKRVALPYVYGHYGHTLQPRRHAEKGRHYSSLGATGNVLREDELDDFDVPRYFAPVYPRLLRFTAAHPAAALASVERLRPLLQAHHALTARIARAQPPHVKVRNLGRRLNYEARWRSRSLSPLGRSLAR
jgi:hypothetical protein